MTDYNNGKWHGWNGGDCPVHPCSIVEVQWDDCREHRQACDIGLLWHESEGDEHFAAFRVIKPYTEPREFWIERSETGTVLNVHERLPIGKQFGAELIHVREVLEDQEEA